MVSRELFSERLHEVCRSRNLTQKMVSDGLRLPLSRVNNWFTGTSVPFLDVAADLADMLEVSLDYLTGRTDKLSGGYVGRARDSGVPKGSRPLQTRESRSR
jgi:transcriptional regulator with XRE-family HTH domain